MATTQKTQADVEFNNGLERGRKHQERGGYPVPQRALDLPEAASRAYLAGWGWWVHLNRSPPAAYSVGLKNRPRRA